MHNDLAKARDFANSTNANARDWQEWTPLHHAALIGNEQMIKLLKDAGANSLAQEKQGATCEDFRRWTTFQEIPQEKQLPLYFQEENGQKHLMTAREYFDKTQSHYVKENVIDPRFLMQRWKTPKEPDPIFIFNKSLLEAYLAKAEKRPIHLLKRVVKDSEGRPLAKAIGLGLFASQPLAKGDPVGSYNGLCPVTTPRTSVFGIESGVDGSQLSNEFTRANDGFPNMAMIHLDELKGIHDAFFALEAIPEGAELCWNYGDFLIKAGFPYVELRAKPLRDFVKQHSLEELVGILNTFFQRKQCTYEIFCLAKKFQYILDTPAVLFNMILDGTLSPAQAQQFLDVTLQIHPHLRTNPVAATVIIAKTVLDLGVVLAKVDQKAAKEFADVTRALIQGYGLLPTVIAFTVHPLGCKLIQDFKTAPTGNRAAGFTTAFSAILDTTAKEFMKTLIQKRNQP